MNVEQRLAELLRSDAEGYQPGDGREAIRRRARARRRARIARRVALPLIAAAILAAVAIPTLSAGSSHRVTTVNTPPAGGTTQPVATTSRPTAPDALGAYLAAHHEAVSHSDVVSAGGAFIAVVALEPSPQHRSIVVLDLGSGSATSLAELPLPDRYFDFAPATPIVDGDLTGDGRPDFLVLLRAADNDPGVIVSSDDGNWRLLPAQPANGGVPADSDVYIVRSPYLSGSQLRSTYDDCKPSCAAGHTSTVTWLYDRNGGYFRPGPRSAPLQGGYYADGLTGRPHYDLMVNRATGGFSGWLFLIYQDGRVSVLFHYTAVTKPDGTFALSTDATSQTFPFAFQSPGAGQAGATPIGPGHHYSGTYGPSTISLGGCQSYLYWANPANSPIPEACAFTYNGTST